MGQIQKVGAQAASQTPTAFENGELRVLAVSNLAAAAPVADGDSSVGLCIVTFDDLTEQMLIDEQPDVVISPLMTPAFDCLEVAYRLSQVGFSGRYRAFAANLPRPEMVQREIQSAFPALDFSIVVTGT